MEWWQEILRDVALLFVGAALAWLVGRRATADERRHQEGVRADERAYQEHAARRADWRREVLDYIAQTGAWAIAHLEYAAGHVDGDRTAMDRTRATMARCAAGAQPELFGDLQLIRDFNAVVLDFMGLPSGSGLPPKAEQDRILDVTNRVQAVIAEQRKRVILGEDPVVVTVPPDEAQAMRQRLLDL